MKVGKQVALALVQCLLMKKLIYSNTIVNKICNCLNYKISIFTKFNISSALSNLTFHSFNPSTHVYCLTITQRADHRVHHKLCHFDSVDSTQFWLQITFGQFLANPSQM